MAKWCNDFNCWCDEVEEIYDVTECDLNCKNCPRCEDIKPNH